MSRALALIVPLMIVVTSIGTFLAVSAVGYVGGRMMASGVLEIASGLLVLRLLLGLLMFAIVSLAIVSPAQSALSRYTRLLLLPIQRRVLHLIEVLAALGDPWIAVVAAGLTMFAIGVFAGGRPLAAMVALAAAMLTVAVVVCAGSLAGFLVAWLMRDRRRGELFTLIFVIAFSLMALIPAFLTRAGARPTKETDAGGAGPADRIARQIHQINVDEFDRHLPGWTWYVPSEVYGRTIGAAMAGDRRAVARGLAVLAAEATVLFVISARVHRRMMGALEGDRSRRRSTEIELGSPPLPLLSPGASAVAWALIHGSLRSVRGRLTILLPGPMLALLVAVFKRLPQETWTADAASRGYLLFGGSVVFTFYAMHAISLNLFGSDRAGLTMQLLAPVTDRELAWGKSPASRSSSARAC